MSHLSTLERISKSSIFGLLWPKWRQIDAYMNLFILLGIQNAALAGACFFRNQWEDEILSIKSKLCNRSMNLKVYQTLKLCRFNWSGSQQQLFYLLYLLSECSTIFVLVWTSSRHRGLLISALKLHLETENTTSDILSLYKVVLANSCLQMHHRCWNYNKYRWTFR